MQRTSRRALLLAAGSSLCAGCVGDSGGSDPTKNRSTTGPSAENESDPPEWASELDPLGYRAIPEGSADPPAYSRQHEPDEITGDIVSLSRAADGFRGLLYHFGGDEGPESPTLVRFDADGAVTSQRALTDLPSNRAYHLERVGETTVVGGMHRPDGEPQTWLRGYRGGEVVFDHTRPGTTYSSLISVDGSLVGAGTLGWQRTGDDRLGAILTRLSPEGTVEWETTIDDSGVEPRFWSVTRSRDGLLAAGARDNRPWFVTFGAEGRERWRKRIELEEAYVVRRLAVGSTGTYALAQTNQFATGNNHLLLLSLGPEGGIEWARVFDPNYDEYAAAPHDLDGVGVVDADGPVLVGSADGRGWLAAVRPDGEMRWAGYDPRRDPSARPIGMMRTADGVVVYGAIGTPGSGTVQPWLAWIDL